MKRVLAGLFVASLLVVSIPAARAAPRPTWARWLSFQAKGLDVAPHGGVVVVGSTRDAYPGGRIVLRGIRSDGSVAWGTAWKPDDGFARASDVDSTGRGVYTSGAVSPISPGESCGEIGSFGWMIRGASSFGRTAWIRSSDGWRECDSTSGDAIGAGGGVVALATTNSIEGSTDIHGEVRGFSGDGAQLWVNRFEPFPVGGPDGYDADDVTALALDGHGRTYAAGWAWRYPREDGADHEAVLMAIDRMGRRRWVRVLGEPKQPKYDRDRGTDVELRGGRVVFGAIVDRAEGPSVARVIVYDDSGTVRWSTGFPAWDSWSSTVQITPGANGTVYLANIRPRTDGNDLIVRKLAKGGRVIRSFAMNERVGLIDLAAGDGGLYVLARRHVWRYPA